MTKSRSRSKNEIKYKILKNKELNVFYRDNIEMIGAACREKISYSFIKGLFREPAEGERICVVQYKNNDIIGVSIMDLFENGWYHKSLYIHLLCTMQSTQKLGTQLLKYIQDNICGDCVIELDSLDAAKGFYTKMGFKSFRPHRPSEFSRDLRK